MKEALTEIILQLRSVWRYRWYAMIVVWLVTVIGWSVIIIVPDRFESSARVFVDTDSLLRPLLKGLAVQTDIDQRLRLMTRTLLSRPNLERIARDTDMDIAATSDEEREKLYEDLKESISFSSTRKQNLYTISFKNKNPEVTKSVVQSVLNIFVETSLGDTRQDTDSAQRFLDKQIDVYESRLVVAENKLTAFKRKHIGTLPDQGGGIFQRMQETTTLYDQAKLDQREAKFKRDELKKQYDSVLSGESNSNAGLLLSPTEERILALQKRLDELLLIYTEEYPDVKEIRLSISRLKLQASSDHKIVGNSDENTEGSAMLAQLRLALSTAEADLAAIRVRTTEYKRRLTKMEGLVDTLPQVETELKRLSRDYDLNKTNYSELLARRESARMAESADAMGDNVKFKIVDPPRLPILPVSPNRPLLSSMVLAMGLIAGGAFILLLAQLNPVVLDSNTLRKVSGMPVLGSVGRIWTPALKFKRKLEVGAFFTVGAGLVAVFIVVIIVNLYGNDLILIRLMREM